MKIEILNNKIFKLQPIFRNLIAWNIICKDNGTDYKKCTFNVKLMKATIYPWKNGKMAKDYIFHELVHISLAEHKYRLKRKDISSTDKHEMEEEFVQDICKPFRKYL